jgi:Protein of unknown function (DUF1549)/Protein of unknown function (DUF1553)/Planctomycete cytochrome C
MFRRFAIPASMLLWAALGLPNLRAENAVNFSRDVLPILSDNCFYCHGPDEKRRKGNLRLDVRESAVAEHDGLTAIVPGKVDDSELMTRLLSKDPDEVMPPPKSNHTVTAKQVEILRRWIASGAVWGKHWALEKPLREKPPENGIAPIDAFVRAKLPEHGLTPSPEAARYTLIRRVSFDLTGLPPTPEEVDAFVKDPAPNAYERLVERLLRSEHFGERMAMWWLDAARYADTDGYQGDDTRTNWPWRDWVSAAFNRNEPFDQFTIEQFAGDLLPNATPEQKLATCFHRNHMTNGEGGRDPEESRIDYVIDRTNTVGTLWLGLTLGCCQCHSHKFDPISQTDYYSLTAFFNSIDEDGKAGHAAKPYLAYRSPYGARAVEEARRLVDERKPVEAEARKAAEAPFAEWLTGRLAEVRHGFQAWRPLIGAVESMEGTTLNQEADGAVQSSGPNPRQDDYRVIGRVPVGRVTGLKLEVFPHESNTGGGLSRGASGHFILTDIKVQVRRRGSTQVRDLNVESAVADYSADPKKHNGYGPIAGVLDDDPRNGWSTLDGDAKQTHTAVFALAEPFVPAADEELIFELRQRSTLGDANIGRFRISVTDQPGPATQSVEPAPLEELAANKIGGPSEIDAKLRARLFEQFLADYAPYAEPKSALDRANRQFSEVKKAAGAVEVMVLAERKAPRESNILIRGVWDKKGDKVECNVPPAIAPWPEGEQRSRLGLARWLVSKENPLTARVMVNHLWQLLFGAGLVRTPEDFGLQGERPTHPELLDWLAVELMESGWDVKHMVQLMVSSATYRQSSAMTEAALAKDPENRWLARGSRFRLPAWMLRDAALETAGLLNPAIGGPPVKPFQPPGVWEEIFMGRFRYEPSEGAAQNRRTLYAFWRRSIAPTFLFDSAQRRVCEVRPARTNTPLQALTLLNDATYLEASRSLAEGAIRNAKDAPGRLEDIMRRVLARPPHESELAVLKKQLERALDHYRAHPEDASRWLVAGNAGHVAPPEDTDSAETAAYMLVSSLILNLDEAITHE